MDERSRRTGRGWKLWFSCLGLTALVSQWPGGLSGDPDPLVEVHWTEEESVPRSFRDALDGPAPRIVFPTENDSSSAGDALRVE